MQLHRLEAGPGFTLGTLHMDQIRSMWFIVTWQSVGCIDLLDLAVKVLV